MHAERVVHAAASALISIVPPRSASSVAHQIRASIPEIVVLVRSTKVIVASSPAAAVPIVVVVHVRPVSTDPVVVAQTAAHRSTAQSHAAHSSSQTYAAANATTPERSISVVAPASDSRPETVQTPAQTHRTGRAEGASTDPAAVVKSAIRRGDGTHRVVVVRAVSTAVGVGVSEPSNTTTTAAAAHSQA